MTLVAVVQLVMLVNMGLFVAAFTAFAQPPALVQALMVRLERVSPLGEAEVHEQAARGVLRLAGFLLAGALGVWSLFAGFVIGLYRAGFFAQF